jgi:prevent-host-death family protein
VRISARWTVPFSASADALWPTAPPGVRGSSPSVVMLRSSDHLTPDEQARLIVTVLVRVGDELEQGAIASASITTEWRPATQPPSRPRWEHQPIGAARRDDASDRGTGYGATVGAMDLSNDVEPVTALKRSAAELIARATERHSPIVITQNGKPTAVLQDVHSYQRQQRLLHLLKLLAQGEHDHRTGRTHDQASADELVTARLAERRGSL